MTHQLSTIICAATTRQHPPITIHHRITHLSILNVLKSISSLMYLIAIQNHSFSSVPRRRSSHHEGGQRRLMSAQRENNTSMAFSLGHYRSRQANRLARRQLTWHHNLSAFLTIAEHADMIAETDIREDHCMVRLANLCR